MASIFYLHGGPGLSVAIESTRFPLAEQVQWWQQPSAASCAQRPYLDLLEAALAEFRRSAQAHGAPLTLMASSFGAHLATYIANHAPEAVARVVLLAPTYNPEQAALRLARHALAVNAGHADVPKVQAALAAYDAAPGRAKFWEVFGVLQLLPDVPSLYFGPNAGDAPGHFLGVLHQPGAFDGPSSVAISDDFAASFQAPGRSAFNGPVSIVFGRHDPMIDAEHDGALWRAVFPQAVFRTVDSGHFPLLESSVEACLA
ncbi:alpha/beta fold hydrolase [Rugamonas aquatica]|uniref:Alpha/beta hydrolase n=1 Tax=Rugamonas aquatica TaxID=2743357 RepID=A0A6A7N1R3_9BURK|nr:alpha/beta fold hydrolase [Rugamonas aquatica]MQA38973.1 alpha/beta hydrolase [Rugamonas aquatica]